MEQSGHQLTSNSCVLMEALRSRVLRATSLVSAASFTGLAVDDSNIVWIGTWTQFTINGSTLIRLDATRARIQCINMIWAGRSPANTCVP